MLWTANEAAAATGGLAIGDWSVNGVSIDTRTIAAGDLFVALKAARDGHDFVAQALDAGAGAALVSRIPDDVAQDAPLLLVEDVLSGLEALGCAARARSQAKVVAVTGSVGKTSTKEMLRTVLGAQGRVHAAEKSYNNHWGVPLTLARMPVDAEFAVIEIGMNHPGEISPLAKMARPDVAMITIVAPAHLAAFDGLDGIAREKAAIFDGLEPGGVAVINGDLEVSPILDAAASAQTAHVIRFGESAANDHRLTKVTIRDTCTVAQGIAGEETVLFKVMAPGRHFATNAMGVLGVVTALDLDLAMAITALGQWSAGAGRGAREIVVLDAIDPSLSVELIDDAYNSNPASLAASLEVLAAAEPKGAGRRIAYLGDMAELGATEQQLHMAIADLPSTQQVDQVHCVGPLMHAMWQGLPAHRQGRWCATSAGMAAGVAQDMGAADVVLVKGSLSMGMSRVVDAIRKMGQSPAERDG